MAESNGIVVRGIPQRTHVDDLWKTFERCYSATCSIEYIIFPLNFNLSTAYVHFTAFPEKAFTLEHKVQGQTVTVEPAPLAVFNKCCAEVDAIIVAGIPDVTECIAELNEEFGVKSSYSPDSGKFLVEGSLLQLQHVTDRLLEVFTHQQRVQQRQLLRLTQYPDIDSTSVVNTAARPSRFQHQPVTPVENWNNDSQREWSDRPAYTHDTGREEQSLKHCVHTHCRHTHVHNVGCPIGSTAASVTGGDLVTGGGAAVHLPHPPCYSDEHLEQGRRAGKHFIAHGADVVSPGRPVAAAVNVDKVPGYSDPAITPGGKKLPEHDPGRDVGLHHAGGIDAASVPTGSVTADHHKAGSMSPSSPLSPPAPGKESSKDQLECVIPADTATSDLDYYVVEYLLRSEKSRLKKMEQEFGVTVRAVNRVCDEIVTVAFQRFNPTINAQNEQKAQETFLALYETIYHNIIQRTIHVSPSQPISVAKLVDSVHTGFKDQIFASAKGSTELILVGPYSEVSKVEMHVQNRINNKPAAAVNDSVERPDVEGARPAPGKLGIGSSVDDDDDDDSDVELTPVDSFVFNCRDNLRVCVYSADITKLRVDAIINAANERLLNYGGVAGAIEKAGGDKLREDCKRIVDSDGPLKVAEVVHTAARGRLKCHYVVHTVGPMWTLSSDKSRCTMLLQRTFENVLHYCNHVLKVSSVAIPAIGSGVFEVPLDVCAEAMFKAVEVFADKVTQITIREIHLVNIDPNTTHLIQTVFEHLTTIHIQQLTSRPEEPSGQDGDGSSGRKHEVENSSVGAETVKMETGNKVESEPNTGDHQRDNVVMGTGVEAGGKVVNNPSIETDNEALKDPTRKTVNEVMMRIGVEADGKVAQVADVETGRKVVQQPAGEMVKGSKLADKMKVAERKEKCDSKLYQRTSSFETEQTQVYAVQLESVDQLKGMERDPSGSSVTVDKLEVMERDPRDSSVNLVSEEAGLLLTDPTPSANLGSTANTNQLDEVNASLEPSFVEPGSFELVSAELSAAEETPTRLD